MADLAVYVIRNTVSEKFMTRNPLEEGGFDQAAIFPSATDAGTAIQQLLEMWQYEWEWSQKYIGRSQPAPMVLEALDIVIPEEVIPPVGAKELAIEDLAPEEIAKLEGQLSLQDGEASDGV